MFNDVVYVETRNYINYNTATAFQIEFLILTPAPSYKTQSASFSLKNPFTHGL